MKITAKGQVIIPQEIREQYKLLPGTEVEFVHGKDGLQLRPRKHQKRLPKPADLWLVKAAGSALPGLTTDQVLNLTRGE